MTVITGCITLVPGEANVAVLYTDFTAKPESFGVR